MNLTFRLTDRPKESVEIKVEFMLYICKGCDHSFSLPLLPEREEAGFLLRCGEKEYYYLSFAENAALYQELRGRLKRYAYPYLNFEGFEPTAFLDDVEQRLWADLVDARAGETVTNLLLESGCPHCGSWKRKGIGRLLPCQGSEVDFRIWRGSLSGFLSLPEEEQNRVLILLMKEYAKAYRSERND